MTTDNHLKFYITVNSRYVFLYTIASRFLNKCEIRKSLEEFGAGNLKSTGLYLFDQLELTNFNEMLKYENLEEILIRIYPAHAEIDIELDCAAISLYLRDNTSFFTSAERLFKLQFSKEES